MSLSHELKYYHPDGTAGDMGAWTSFSLLYGLNGIGELVIAVPMKNRRSDYFKQNGICEVWRSVNGVARLEGQKIWRLRSYSDYYDADRRRWAEMHFLDDNDLLDTRIIESFNGTNAGTELIAADDYMKTAVSEQNDSSRANGNLTVAANTTQAATVSRITGYNNLYDTLVNIHKATLATTPVFFDCVRTSPTTSEFRTFYGHRGVDRGADSGQALVVSMEAGNMVEPRLTYDWREEVNFVYAFGQGEGSSRTVGTYPASYPTNGALLRESAIDARNVEVGDTAELTQAAKVEYEKRKTRPRFSCNIQDTPSFRYQRDYNYGDVLVANYHNQSFDVHISTISRSVNDKGKETLTVSVKNYE